MCPVSDERKDEMGEKVSGIEVVELETGEVVRVIPVDPPMSAGSRHLEQLMMGLLRNADTDRFVFREVSGWDRDNDAIREGLRRQARAALVAAVGVEKETTDE